MTGCDCKKALAALEEYLRRELCDLEAEEIRAHLCECAHCSEELRVGQMLTLAVKRACGENAPDELKARVLARLRCTDTAQNSASA